MPAFYANKLGYQTHGGLPTHVSLSILTQENYVLIEKHFVSGPCQSVYFRRGNERDIAFAAFEKCPFRIKTQALLIY